MTNSVILIGRLARDIEIRYLNDTPMGRGTLAVSETWYGKDKQKKEKTHWIPFAIWGPRAKALADHTGKGSRIALTGSLDFQEWTDKNSGSKRTKIEVKASGFEFLDMKKSRANQGNRNQSSPPQRQSRPETYGDPAGRNGDEIPF